MDSTVNAVLFVVLGVMIVLYLMRRKARLNKEDE
jgi:hypothetical protein